VLFPLQVHFLRDAAEKLLLMFSESACFFDVASCPSSLCCPKWWRRFLDLFYFLGRQITFELSLSIKTLPKSKSKLYYDRWSVGQSILVSGSHLGPRPMFLLLSLIIFYTVKAFVDVGALSDERSGL
jgi:hypothetical protein